jgi:hypothetical protein
MLQLIMAGLLAWNNSLRAKRKELNPILWAVYTVIAFFVSFIIGSLIVIFVFCRNVIDFNMMASQDEKVRLEASKMLENAILSNPLHSFTLVLFSFGGYLFVRYLIDRKPGKKTPEVHWMDKMGDE